MMKSDPLVYLGASMFGKNGKEIHRERLAMSNNREKPIEELLGELDAEYSSRQQHPDLVGNVKAALHYALLFLGNWPRLSKELRQRLEREQELLKAKLNAEIETADVILLRKMAEERHAKEVAELRQRIEKEKQSDVGPKRVKACLTCTDPYCAECSEADHPDNYCSRVCEGRSETEDSVAEE